MTSIAIVHDYLTQRGGAERVVLELMESFPDASIHTSLYEPSTTYPEFSERTIETSVLNRFSTFRDDHRRAAPFLAPVFSTMTVDADVVLCSSSGWAHAVRTSGRKIVYCYNPARWLYQADLYHQELAPAVKAVSRSMSLPLRRWDRHAAKAADRYIAISTAVQTRIANAYGIHADVIHPPTTLDPSGREEPVEGLEPGFLLSVARLLPYKKVDIVIEALDHVDSDLPLVVVGSGPDRKRLEALAKGRNVVLLGNVTEEEIRWLYRSCKALVTASFEDFGLTPIEAALFGRPTVAMRWGGFLDTTVEGLNGVFFEKPTPSQVGQAVTSMLARSWDEQAIRSHASGFSRERFRERIRSVVHEE